MVTDLDKVEDTQDNVILMTLHSAKGLEYPVVFLVGMEEGVFPSVRSLSSEVEIEEERRLCYVGITRAKQKLFITNANRRTMFGNTSFNKESRFVKEIPEELINRPVNKKKNVYSETLSANRHFNMYGTKKTLPRYSDFIVQEINNKKKTECDFKKGDAVVHKKFGSGIINKIEKEDTDYKLEIMFEDAGMKRMMASFANLERMQ